MQIQPANSVAAGFAQEAQAPHERTRRAAVQTRCLDAASAVLPQTARGSAQGRPADASPFRERGGGEALRRAAISYYPFDQANYSGRIADGRRGSCEGWVREAARFLDRNTNVLPSLLQAVYEMESAANTRSTNTARDLFGRIGAFQQSATSLGFRRYSAAGSPVTYQNPFLPPSAGLGGESVRVLTVHRMLADLTTRLKPGDIAHVRLDAGPVVGEHRRVGHALLIERMLDNRYAVFDPNNGVFIFGNPLSMYDGLRQYLDEAFTGARLLTPDQIQFYSLTPPGSVSPGASSQRWVQPADNREEPMQADPLPAWATREAYQGSSQTATRLSRDALAAAAGEPVRQIEGDGLPMYVLNEIAQGSSADLAHATERTWREMSTPIDRLASQRDMTRFAQANPHGLVGELDGYVRRNGIANAASADRLVQDLEGAFSQPHRGDLAQSTYPADFAVVDLGFRNTADHRDLAAGRSPVGDTHAVIVQRLQQTADFRTDRYEIYDPDVGVFTYENFADLAFAWRGIFRFGYSEFGGVRQASTCYYLNTGRPNQDAASAPGAAAQAAAGDIELAAIERALGRVGTLPRLDPPTAPAPLPVFPDPDEPQRVEFRRSAEVGAIRQPVCTFRPSSVSPAELKEAGGFNCERTKLASVNLQLHNADLAVHSRLIDSAGYLGTFRHERSALARMPRVAPGRDGYLYFVAPTPNMVDVNDTLGSHAKNQADGEIAAMGRLEYAQIRGWKVVSNGVAGPYIANPDYRWDIFDQTTTAGAQPQLARFPIDSDAWQSPSFASYVSNPFSPVATRAFRTRPNLALALFYDHAWQKVRDLATRQSANLDYRGLMRIQAYSASDRTHTEIYLDGQDNVYVNTMYAPSSQAQGTRHYFVMSDAGRLHVAGSPDKVLRVDGNGYVYAGPLPTDNASLNGVFEYARGHLIHQEDGKLLTAGLSSYTPFVDHDRGVRSQWSLKNPDGANVAPPHVNLHTFRNSSAGNAKQLYSFYMDPDSALPRCATHFVTAIPGGSTDQRFLDYLPHYVPAEMRATAEWLRSHNAAWLFKDGFYAVSEAPGTLEVRTLGGAPAFRAEGLMQNTGQPQFTRIVSSSNYRIPDETWELLRKYEQRHAATLSALQNHALHT